MAMKRVGSCSTLGAMVLMTAAVWGQQSAPAPAPPADPTAVSPQTPASGSGSAPVVPSDTSTAPMSSPGTAPAPPAEPMSEPPQTPAATPEVPKEGAPASPKLTLTGRKGKEIYTGPTEVVMLEATPMLDEEGKQRLDPNGKPMFNPPVAQQRDKKGHPLFDEKGKPVFQTAGEMGYDVNGKKIHSEKEKKVHMVAVSIVHGTMTVDGMTGKAGLNYEISDLKYIYLYVPWIGMTIISNGPFPGAIEEKEAFKENTLTVKADDHVLELYSEKKLLGKRPESAYVLVDRSFSLQTKFPLMGYGDLRQAPYAFPGSKVEVAKKGAAAPPLPASLRPGTVLPPCPAGEMRPAGAVVLAGQPMPACETIRVAAPKIAAMPNAMPAK